MGLPLYVGLKTCTQLEATAGRLLLILCRPHGKFGDGLAERLPYPYGVHPWALIQYSKATFHQSTVSSPGGGGLSHPVGQIGNDDYEILRRTSEEKEPLPQLNRLISQRPSSALELGYHPRDVILKEFKGHHLHYLLILLKGRACGIFHRV